VFFLAGAMDFYLHVAALNTQDLRDFVVVNLSGNPDVALTETSLIFEHTRAADQGRERGSGLDQPRTLGD
jgi:hypothetical protein